jgi:hypothetical protein
MIKDSLKKFIEDNCYTKTKNLNNRVCIESWWRNKNLIDIYNTILDVTSFLSEKSSLSERLYCVYNDIVCVSNCQVCNVKKVVFKSYKKGYSRYCSAKCSTQCPDRNEKIVFNTDREMVIQNMRKTNLERYGVEYTTQTQNMKNKTNQTKVLRYGNAQYNNNEKAKQTNLKKYGTEYSCLSESAIKKKEETWRRRRPQLFDENWLKDANETKSLTDISTDLVVTYRTVYLAFERAGITPKFFIPKYNKTEKDIQEYIKNDLHIQDILINDRNLIKPKEIDILIQEKNVAIELNGIYWHSYDHVPNKEERERHKTKMMLCREKNITLVQFWDDEWVNKTDICKDIIRRSLGKSKYVHYARNTEIQHIDTEDCNDFLSKHHIQGPRNGSIRYGLYHKQNKELLSVMVFGKSRYRKDCDYELIRYCTKHNQHVLGGIEKMFKKFMIENKPKSIISYNDTRLFTGKSYEKLGFKKVSTSLDYYWVKNGRRLNRNLTQKHKLESLLGKDNFDRLKTEDENLLSNGYRKLYGCGQECWLFNKKEGH